MNKQMTRWFDTWCKYAREGHAQSMHDFYTRPSSRKVSIYIRICHEHGGSVRILNATCHFFTVGYMTQSLSDGVYSYEFVVETAYNTYTAPVSLHELHGKGLDILPSYKEPVVVPLYRG